MTKKRPVGITILAVLAAIAALIAIIHTLQFLHLFPIRGPFGVFNFFTFDLFGAILWGVMALIYLWVMNKLLNLDPEGWLFVAALSTLNLILAVISIFGQSTWQAMLPAILINGLILIYTLLPSTKQAFDFPTEAPAAAAPAKVVEPASVEPEVSVPPVQEPEEEAETPLSTMVTGAAAASHELSYVEGIGEVYGGKLKEAGLVTPQDLLERGATPKGRKELAEATGISEHMILKWVNDVDLYRIKGIGSEYADLLEASGVDTVVELAQRNPTNLFEKLNEVNAEKKLVRQLPTQPQVEEWVNQAKQLPRVISY